MSIAGMYMGCFMASSRELAPDAIPNTLGRLG